MFKLGHGDLRFLVPDWIPGGLPSFFILQWGHPAFRHCRNPALAIQGFTVPPVVRIFSDQRRSFDFRPDRSPGLSDVS